MLVELQEPVLRLRRRLLLCQVPPLLRLLLDQAQQLDQYLHLLLYLHLMPLR
jgi:hypothetical protein